MLVLMEGLRRIFQQACRTGGGGDGLEGGEGKVPDILLSLRPSHWQSCALGLAFEPHMPTLMTDMTFHFPLGFLFQHGLEDGKVLNVLWFGWGPNGPFPHSG